MPDLSHVTILGATGTIGVNTLDVIERHPDRYRVFALTANRRFELLLEQCRRFRPRYAVMLETSAAEQLHAALMAEGLEIEVLAGVEALVQVASMPEVDIVMAAIVGAAGLRPSLAAAEAGKRVLLANKETLVMSGSLFMQSVHRHGATLLPIDSEHNAIFQCLPHEFSGDFEHNGITKILLTASGGPFRALSMDQLADVTPQQALNHPNWVMGPKITIDSATMMNKGLEVIEACWLFGAQAEQIEVVIHPQSIVHSMVQYNDGSVLAELGNPDMRTPIAHALAWPDRIDSGVASLDIFEIARLDFERPDLARFPCLRLAFEALQRQGTAPTVLNAVNEIAVQAFIEKKIGFMQIPTLIETVLSEIDIKPVDHLNDVVLADSQSRTRAELWLERHAG